jgi:hypothetical protein
MNENKPKVRRPGSGRTKGSFSFVKVSLKDLQSKIADQDSAIIIISRKWAEQVGFTNIHSAPVTDITGSIEGQTPNTKIAAKVQELD